MSKCLEVILNELIISITLLLSASFGKLLPNNYHVTNGILRWGIFTSTLGFSLSHKISYKVAWFTVSSFRRTPKCVSSEKHFKCDFKISDSLFHQGKKILIFLSQFCIPTVGYFLLQMYFHHHLFNFNLDIMQFQ